MAYASSLKLISAEIMRKAAAIIIFMLALLGGCTADSDIDERSEISVIGLGSKFYSVDQIEDILFTGNDILWFDTATREVRFKSTFNSLRFRSFTTVLFRLSDMNLFTATYLNGSPDSIVENLVFYHDTNADKYFLYDNYPVSSSTVASKYNKEIRAENWASFIIQMRREGRIH